MCVHWGVGFGVDLSIASLAAATLTSCLSCSHLVVRVWGYSRLFSILWESYSPFEGNSVCFSTAVPRYPPRHKSRAKRLKAKVEPLLT